MKSLTGFLISSFNIGNFARYLENDEDTPRVTCTSAPFGHVMGALLAPAPATTPDFAFVWTSPEHVSPEYGRCLDGLEFSADVVRNDVDQFCAAVRSFSARHHLVFVATLCPVIDRATSSLLGMRDTGASRLLADMNQRLVSNLRECRNVYVLDSTRWMERAAGSPRDPKLWYLAKVPFTNDVFVAAVRDLKGCLAGVKGAARKLVILDLDDTLWGGIVGDVGWEKLRLGGHDPAGEAFVDFQRSLKALSRRGVILGVVSKNEADVALEAIDRHPEMVLRRSDLAGWRINREDKARNIVNLVHELNLGLESVVFIDDSAVERARVRESLPEVLVPEWPADSMLYSRALADLRCFEWPALTAEDAARTEMYNSERTRTELLERIGSVDEWLKSLQLRVEVEEVGGANLERVVQLLNKTNQMNLATRRFSDGEFRAWLAGQGRRSWCFRVIDRLGDSGITGLLSVEQVRDAAVIRDFVLSCRVMGRKIEETMLHVAVDHARSVGMREVRAEYARTTRNQPCLDFLKSVGFPGRDGEDVFIWYTNQDYPLPDAISCTTETWRAAV
jgi:FkbH-like protein